MGINLFSSNLAKILLILNGLIVIWLGVISYGIYKTQITQPTEKKFAPKETAKVTVSPTPTNAPSAFQNAQETRAAQVTTPIPAQAMPTIINLQYTLPQGWTATPEAGGITIKPSGNGYFYIKIYTYDGTGRREYYCRITQKCFEERSFVDWKIGNISGYQAYSITNWVGGPDYFGAKGDKFYIINSYFPNEANQFSDQAYKVMASFIF